AAAEELAVAEEPAPAANPPDSAPPNALPAQTSEYPPKSPVVANPMPAVRCQAFLNCQPSLSGWLSADRFRSFSAAPISTTSMIAVSEHYRDFDSERVPDPSSILPSFDNDHPVSSESHEKRFARAQAECRPSDSLA